VYHVIVRGQIRRAFDQVGAGNWSAVMPRMATDVFHSFPGDNALGGERQSREALGRWFGRLFRLFPGFRFDVKRVISGGWPWSTWVAVEWTNRITAADGEAGENAGVTWFDIRWARTTSIREYLDSERVTDACRRMAAAGIEEAAAAPIED
jgi:ketosteroid isomerase-like protein